MPAQFALRVAILCGFALVMFSIIFFRLWYLQVLSGDKYLKQAQNNQVRDDHGAGAARRDPRPQRARSWSTTAPPSPSSSCPTELPQLAPQAARRSSRASSQVIGMSTDAIEKQLHQQTKDLPANPVTLRRDVSYDLVYYLRENQDSYPGVTVQRVYVRNYPDGTLAAQIYGYVREVTEAAAEGAPLPGAAARRPGRPVRDREHLRQRPARDQRHDPGAGGRGGQPPAGHSSARTQPKPGDNLLLSIDTPVQQAGEAAINSFSTPGAFVAMNVQNGEILGLGSSPTFDPSIFTKPVIPTVDLQAAHQSDTPDAPLTDRAIQGLYPTGSTFKPITAMAALESGVHDAEHDDRRRTGSFSLGAGRHRCTTPGAARTARCSSRRRSRSPPTSSSTTSAPMLYRDGNTSAQEKWASDLGHRPSDRASTCPARSPGCCRRRRGANKLFKEAPDPTARGRASGDPTTSNLATVNWRRPGRPAGRPAPDGGRLRGDRATAATSSARTSGWRSRTRRAASCRRSTPAPQRHLDINPQLPATRSSRGIHMAAQSPGGTSYPVFGNFPIPMAGKTGTAQRPGQPDQSWYVALAPYPNPEDRRRGDDRAGRLRRPGRGARRAADPRRLLQHAPAGGQDGRRQGALAGRRSRPQREPCAAGNPY